MAPDLETRTLDRPGCRLAYRHRASAHGAWVVFLHGAGMDGHMFDAQIAAVPAETGVVCWDARAHGVSTLRGRFRYGDMCRDLEALIGSLHAETLCLVGQSMGGNLAQTYVDRNPGAVDRLVLINCTDNHGPLSLMDRAALRSTPGILRLYPWSLTVRQAARACGATEGTVAYAEQALRRVGKRRFAEIMGFGTEALEPSVSARLPVPTLALLGAEDRTGNIRTAMSRLARIDPQVELVTLPGAAHNSNMDQPAATNAALRAFCGW